MYSISKDFIVPNGLIEHVVRIKLHGTHVDDTGFVIDYNDLAPLKGFLLSQQPYLPQKEVAQWAYERWGDYSPEIFIRTRERTGSPTQHHSHFSASHQLSGLADDHPCSRLHGHNYRVIVFLKNPEKELPEVDSWIDNFWDHRHINDLVDYNPTAENMAKHMFDYISNYYDVRGVAVSETPKTWALYGEGDIYSL